MFVHQILVWGFLLALLPLLIHLINMMRHQRVKWAAMEFLLQSYKKHRKWIWLKQLLLLLARMAAIALLVAMLAQWITKNQWFDLFSGRATHHYVLLDDSYSMSDRAGTAAASAYDTAKQAITRLVQHIGQSDEFGQKLTLIRFSKAARSAGVKGDAKAKVEDVADFNAELIDASFDQTLEEKRNQFDITQLAVGPLDAVNLVRELLQNNVKDRNVVYLVSDFRMNQWDKPEELAKSIQLIEKSGAEVQLVNCVKQAQANLGITDIRTGEDTRAAGVNLYVYVTVKNYGNAVVKRVQLKTRTIFFSPELTRSGDVNNATGQAEDLLTQLIEEIKPGESVTTRVQLSFPEPGQHVVEASLPEDAVATDNRRWTVVDCPDGEPVLIVDDATHQWPPSYYLTSLFEPGERAKTGVQAEVKTSAFLRDVTPGELNRYHSIYMTNISRLDDRAAKNLEEYVAAGGGLAIFVGPNVNFASYNQTLYRDGEGLLPLPLERIDVLPPRLGANAAMDIDATEHPLFRFFTDQRAHAFIREVNIESYVRTAVNWKPPAGSTVEIAARLRNREPLVVEKRIGGGKVVVFLTSIGNDWNNWVAVRAFPITMLNLQAHLASAKRPSDSRVVGSPISVSLDAEKYLAGLKFVKPGTKVGTRVVVERTATRPKENSPVLQASLGRTTADNDESGDTGETDRAGVYEAWSSATSGQFETRRFAVNVESAEGDLATVDGKELVAKLMPAKVKYLEADSFAGELEDKGGFDRSLLLMALLIALLIGEQLLAYSASYHPPQVKGASPVPVLRLGNDRTESVALWQPARRCASLHGSRRVR